jgi:thiamine-phosphate pyrophosphorylase
MGRQTSDIVREAVMGGVTCVQLREKSATTREFIREAISLQPLLKQHKVPLIINDRLDVALAVGADGVHLGQQDMPLTMARAIVADRMIIGVSAESVADARAAEREGADYIGVSPIYDTPTKSDTAAALGLEGLVEIRRTVGIPLVGIGGLGRDNAAAVIRNGADGIAVVSAIVSAGDPRAAAGELLGVIEGARGGTIGNRNLEMGSRKQEMVNRKWGMGNRE